MMSKTETRCEMELDTEDAPRATHHIGALYRPMLPTGVEALKTLALALVAMPAETGQCPEALGVGVGFDGFASALSKCG
jgi:hypothetical protein